MTNTKENSEIFGLKLNLGCGKLHKPGYINADISQPADEVFDAREGIPFKEENFVRVEADNFFEHFYPNEFRVVINDVWRVLKSGGILWVRVPDVEHWPAGAFGDPTHKMFFCRRSFTYLDKNDPHYKNYENGFKPWSIKSLETDGKFVICELQK